MKYLTSIACCLFLLHLLAVGSASAAVGSSSQVVFGVVATNESGVGVPVGRVSSGSPAELAGLQPGDMIVAVNSQPVTDKLALKAALALFMPGDVVRVAYQRQGRRHVALVELAARTVVVPAPTATSVSVDVPYEISVQMSQARARIRIQLAQLPHRMKPSAVKADLYELRHLATTLRVNQPGWMSGTAGEAELEFADAYGYLLLHTKGGDLALIVKALNHEELSRYPLNTAEQCRSLPRDIVLRLQNL